MNIKLIPLQEHEKETFIRNIQIACKRQEKTRPVLEKN